MSELLIIALVAGIILVVSIVIAKIFTTLLEE